MTTARTFADVFASPARGLPGAAARGSVLPPVIAATLAALAFFTALEPRLDVEKATRDQLERAQHERAEKVAEMTPHQIEEAVETSRKIALVAGWAGAALGPALRALLLALALWVGLRVAGAAPPYRPLLSVAAWGTLPSALGQLLAVPAVLRSGSLAAGDLPRLFPWKLAWWLPPSLPPPLAALAGAVDLFGLWSLALVAVGAAAVAGTSRPRAAAVVVAVAAATTAGSMAFAAATAATR